MLKELVFGSPTKKSIRRDRYKACFEVNSINAEKRKGLLESVVESFVIRFSQNLRIACFLLGNDFRWYERLEDINLPKKVLEGNKYFATKKQYFSW